MANNSQNQEKEEQEIFNKFLQVYPNEQNVQRHFPISQEKNKGDICCEFKDGSKIFFELTQSTDKEHRHRSAQYENIEKLLNCEIKKNIKFQQKYKNAFITVKFSDIKNAKKLISKVINKLIGLNTNVINMKFKDFSINIFRYNGLTMPEFNAQDWSDIKSVTKERLENKFRKEYKNSIELIVYFGQQDVQPRVLEYIQNYIKTKLKKPGHIERVWLFSKPECKILYYYPDCR